MWFVAGKVCISGVGKSFTQNDALTVFAKATKTWDWRPLSLPLLKWTSESVSLNILQSKSNIPVHVQYGVKIE